ncbi:hypothetical protein [Saccharibacillus sacchari]|uniref:Uncharacterized protein n=1 Tax=Saccharibacillus sacchari TaxID=456493 RepID=A0ACC6P726_9BACL
MGTKFANLHIQTQNRQLVLDALQKLSDQAGHVLAKPILRDTNILDPYIQRKEKGSLSRENESHVTYYMHQSGEWTTVLNSYFEWETVSRVGELLSMFVVEPVMTVGFFDEDIFEWTIFQDGEVRCRKYFCGTWAEDEYKLEPETMDFAFLQEVVGIKKAGIGQLLASGSPEQAVNQLSSLIGVHVWIDSSWVDHDPELIKKYAKVDLGKEKF